MPPPPAYFRAVTHDPAHGVLAGDLLRLDPATGRVVLFRPLRGGRAVLADMALAGTVQVIPPFAAVSLAVGPETGQAPPPPPQVLPIRRKA